MTKKLFLAALLALIGFVPTASAEGLKVVTGCGSESLTAGNLNPFGSETTTGRQCVETQAAPVTAVTDKGGTIATGGTAQTAIAANASRLGAVVENPPSATENLYVALVGSATVAGAGNYASLAPGGSVAIVGTGAVSVNASSTGHRFLATEWQ